MSENKGTNTCETDNVKQLKSSIQRLTKSCREKNDERKVTWFLILVFEIILLF